MTKIITNFHLSLYRLKNTYQSTYNDAYAKALITLYNKLLYNYNEETYSDLTELYQKYIRRFPNDIRYIIIFLVILNEAGADKLKNVSFDIIYVIMINFFRSKVFPYNFNKYLNLFLDEEILYMLNELCGLSYELLHAHIMNIIKTYRPEEISSFFVRAEILKELCGILDEPFSPILKRDYTLWGIKEKLMAQATILNLDNQDWKILDMLDHIFYFNHEIQDTLIKRLKDIENTYGCYQTKAVGLMLKEIELTYYNNRSELAFGEDDPSR